VAFIPFILPSLEGVAHPVGQEDSLNCPPLSVKNSSENGKNANQEKWIPIRPT
jgi:hypothetical protein